MKLKTFSAFNDKDFKEKKKTKPYLCVAEDGLIFWLRNFTKTVKTIGDYFM